MPEEQKSPNLIVTAARSLGSAAGKIASLAGMAPAGDAISLLKQDHENVKELFDLFEKTGDRAAKKELVEKAILELKLHAAIEEELFYPAVRQHAGDDLINEADEEHHVVKLLIAELENMDSSADHYDAKFTVLGENVRHHIREEENEIFPKAKSMDKDWEALGQTMQQRKQELLAKGLPPTPEETSNVGHRKAVRRTRRKKNAESKA